MRTHESRPKNRHRSPGTAAERGFTLVEIMVVILIVALMALVTIPNLQRMRIKNRTTSEVLGVARSFDLARFEAVKRHSPVGVIFNPVGNEITVFEDWDPLDADPPPATNSNGNLDGAEETVDSRPFPNALTAVAAPSADATPEPAISTVMYRPDGTLRSGGGAAYVQDAVGNLFRIRINSVTGAVRVEMWTPSYTWTAKREGWIWQY